MHKKINILAQAINHFCLKAVSDKTYHMGAWIKFLSDQILIKWVNKQMKFLKYNITKSSSNCMTLTPQTLQSYHLERYLFKYWNIFVQILRYICPNIVMYLSKYGNIFVHLLKHIRNAVIIINLCDTHYLKSRALIKAYHCAILTSCDCSDCSQGEKS